MFGVSKEVVESVREEFPAGTRVELVTMDDSYSDLMPGDQGTVRGVDDIATIHVQWDNGSTLGVCYGVDSCKKIK